jgi:tRNA N6-adenosine threonylcarbamoyltransferase
LRTILGIESSCDETAASVVVSGEKILSSVVSSQVAVHHRYGGVVPELASRKHIEAVVPVVEEALETAGVSRKEIDAVAVTQGPGLVGSLLVGFSFGRAFAYALGIPWVGVSHLHGHVNSVFLEADPPAFPFVALLVSGGHTAIYHVLSHTHMELMGQTRDDAAGEAYDKVAKMLDLGYPGGVVIDRLAAEGTPGVVKFPRPFLDKSQFDFSFSGLKSAVRRYIEIHPEDKPFKIPDIVTEFQEAVVEVLCYKLIRAAEEKKCRHIALVGGVAANSRLRSKLRRDAAGKGLSVHIPSVDLCGDNAAMIAVVGYHDLAAGKVGRWDDDVFSRMPITNSLKNL